MTSFGGAALALTLTSSAIRYQISLLEARLGAILFERQSGRLALTDAGAVFAKQIQRPMRELLAACETATRSARDAPITLTAPPMFAREFLLDGAFLEWCDVNQLHLDVSDSKRELFGPAAVAAIRLDAVADPDLTLTPLLYVKLSIAASPELAGEARPLDPDWWTRQTLLCPSASGDSWGAAWSALELAEPVVSRRVSYSSYSAAMEAACAGGGLILAPLPFANAEFGAGRLAVISPIRILSKTGYSLILRNDLAGSIRGRALTRRLVSLCTA